MSLYSIVEVDNASVPNAATGRFILFLDTDGIWKKKDESGNVTPVSEDDLNDKVKVSANDTTEGYLEDKVQGLTDKISVSTLNDGSNESLQITVGSDIFDITNKTSDNISEGATNLFLTSAESALISSALQSGNNVSELVNDAGYITSSSLKPSFNVNLDSVQASVTRVFAGGRTTFTVTHNLNTLDLKPEVFRLSDGRTIGWRIERTGVNTINVSRAGNIANNLFRVVI
jgi:hypothetical protein|tara:strand:+ start:8322 stop:9011 length:690 start_codon:yes stop_codon:yes gene_type:complete